MVIYLCSCGFSTDDPDWLDGHLEQHADHYQRRIRDGAAQTSYAGTSEDGTPRP